MLKSIIQNQKFTMHHQSLQPVSRYFRFGIVHTRTPVPPLEKGAAILLLQQLKHVIGSEPT